MHENHLNTINSHQWSQKTVCDRTRCSKNGTVFFFFFVVKTSEKIADDFVFIFFKGTNALFTSLESEIMLQKSTKADVPKMKQK